MPMSLLLQFVLGAAGGTILASLATSAGERVRIPGSVPFAVELSPDWRVLSFALVVSLIAGLVFGLAPALQAANADLATRMRGDSAGGGTRRTFLGTSLIVGQLAMSLLLLVGAGLFLRALDRGAHIDPGFDASGVATAAFDTESWGYPDAKGRVFYEQLRERVAALPGVTSVSYSVFLPLTMHSNGTTIEVDGVSGRNGDEGVPVRLLKVDDGYFATVRMPLVAGRPIGREDNEGAPKVVVVNETLARRYFPGQVALGRTIGYDGQRLTIVGVSRDAKYSSLTESATPFIYLPLAQHWEPKHSLMVRTSSSDPLALAPSIASVVRSIDAGVPRPLVSTLRHENTIVLIPQRVAAIVTAVLGAVGLLLATVGLYGVIAYSASRRSREIGIRLALGARPTEVLRMIVGEGMRLTVIGVAIGLVLAAAVTRLLVTFLFGISPLDGATFVAMSLLFVGIAAVASYLPARRAAALDPMVVLRE
jgi:predicted permease